jgi:hypothetical protein
LEHNSAIDRKGETMKSTIEDMIDEDLRDGTVTTESVYPMEGVDAPENGSSSVHLDKIVMPDICSSLSGCTAPNKHCPKCSHAYYTGSVYVGGKENLFEFSPQYGPFFRNKDGKLRKRQPTEKNPVWREFAKWHDSLFGRT